MGITETMSDYEVKVKADIKKTCEDIIKSGLETEKIFEGIRALKGYSLLLDRIRGLSKKMLREKRPGVKKPGEIL
jgi:hypothetical protein